MRPRLLVAAVVVAVGVPVAIVSGLPSAIADAYPYDYAKRAALAKCEAGDPHFLRFSARDRNTCYLGVHLAGYTPTSAN